MVKRRKIDVLILIEHRARELESAVLLKCFFEKKGYSTVIESIKFHKESVVLKYIPSIVIVPWAYSNKEMDLFRNFSLYNEKVLILNMHHEQISNDGSDSFIVPKDDAKKILHVSWGGNYSKKLIEAGCSQDSIIQCGNPRLDFYKGNLKKISDNKDSLARKHDIDSSKKWVLFIANSFHLLSENQININIDKGVDIREQIETSIQNRNDFLKYAEKYLAASDDVIFIYRPHPSFAHLDNKSPEIIELCNKYNNFKCISENSIRDWIINSDVAMSFHSTAVIECAVSNTPFYLFRSKKLSPDKDYKFFENYEYSVKHYEDFHKAIKNNNQFTFDKFNETIKEYIDLKADEYSSSIIVDRVHEIYSSKDGCPCEINPKIDSYLKTVAYSCIKKLLHNIAKISFVRDAMLKTNDIRFFNLFYTGDDYFKQEDIVNTENNINKLLLTVEDLI